MRWRLATPPRQTTDALQRKQLAEMRGWLRWLDEHDAQGFLGEFGFPAGDDFRSWARLARAVMFLVRRADVWHTAWASGRGWGLDYNLGVHVNSTPGGPIDTAQPQAAVIEALPSTPSLRAGVNLAGFEFGAVASRFQPYQFRHTAEDFAYLAARGIDTIRLPVAWERLQPSLGHDLDPTASDDLLMMIGAARRHGIDVILDLHNYGRYTRGDEFNRQVHVLHLAGGHLDQRHLADLWGRLSRLVEGESNVIAYGLMNEPHDLPASAATFEGEIIYGWVSATEQWVAESPRTTLGHSDELGGVLVAERHDLAAHAFNALRVNDGGRRPVRRDSGQILRALVRVEGDPKLPWRAELQFQDDAYTWHSPRQSTELSPGAWTEVISVFESGFSLGAARAWGLQVASDDVGDLASVTITVDDLGQGTDMGPLSPAQTWEAVTNRVVASLRHDYDDDSLLMVAGYNYSKVQSWREHHPSPWVHDPADNLRYEAHHYWDITEEGTYGNTYQAGGRAAAAEGY